MSPVCRGLVAQQKTENPTYVISPPLHRLSQILALCISPALTVHCDSSITRHSVRQANQTLSLHTPSNQTPVFPNKTNKTPTLHDQSGSD